VRAPTEAPHIDWQALSPLLALVGGLCLVLMVGLLRAPFVRTKLVPFLTLVTLGATAGLGIWTWGDNASVLEGALRLDDLTLTLTFVFVFGAACSVLLSWRGLAPAEAGHGEFYALLLTAVLGMVVLAGSTNLVAVFLGYELLSIPLYVLCATHLRRERSLESGLKYLIIGSVGSATLLYGLAFVYGATGSTDFAGIDEALRNGTGIEGDVLFLTGLGFVLVGLAFKASVAPFHQWTPDVYEGAPTPVTAFMAVATKAAALGVILRLFDVALISAVNTWAPALAALAAITIVVGNVGAIGQSSVKRMLAYSSVGQAGYMLTGVVVSTSLGVKATVFYIVVYAFMNLAAFAVVVARERETLRGDDLTALYGLGTERPWLAWPMTIAMLALAGFPATAGFFGKIYLIDAAVENDYAWLGVLIVIGSAISLAYYLRVVAAVWMRTPDEAPEPPPALAARPAMAGGSSEASEDPDARAAEARLARREGADVMRGGVMARAGLQLEVLFVAVLCAAATIFFGVYPDPLLDLAGKAGAALSNLL
jgi:NADH-quinone oxidoreductase subunit N